MARTNVSGRSSKTTHEGGSAAEISPELELRRSVLSCMLWEDTFYENGVDIADRITSLVPKVDPLACSDLAIEARLDMNLRHAPLLLASAMAATKPHRKHVAEILQSVVQRPDELTEMLSIYWRNGKCPVSAQVKKGLASAFPKFDEYQLAKYDRDDPIKLRDVLFLCHAKPKNLEQDKVWKRLIAGELQIPDTWEVALSGGADKKETWERLLQSKKLGSMALLRNLRNMSKVGVDETQIRLSLRNMDVSKILPFRFISAAMAAPQFEPELEQAMFGSAVQANLSGKTAILIDVSSSMDMPLGRRSMMRRIDAACGIAMVAREFGNCQVYTFSNHTTSIPPRRGFALRDAVVSSQPHQGTYLGQAVSSINKNVGYDRLIVITDEQAHDRVPGPNGRGYMINVAPYQNGVGYGAWTHIDGFSESTLDYVAMFESIC